MVRSHSMSLAALAVAISLSGCDRLKAMASGDGGSAGGEGGAASSEGLALPEGLEGEIDVTAKDDKATDGPVALTLFAKSGKLRVDLPEQLAKSGGPLAANAKGYAVFDAAVKKIYVVLDPSKQVIVVDLDKLGEQMKGFTPPSRPGSAAPNAPKEAPPKVTKTGVYDTVAGYKCENWDVASDHRMGTVCVAEQGFSWLSIPMSALNGVPTEQMWMAELLDGKHFPLRFVGYGPDGVKESGRIEVTKIDKKSLPATDFEYPPSYAVIDLEQMLRGLGGMPGGAGGMPPHHK